MREAHKREEYKYERALVVTFLENWLTEVAKEESNVSSNASEQIELSCWRGEFNK